MCLSFKHVALHIYIGRFYIDRLIHTLVYVFRVLELHSRCKASKCFELQRSVIVTQQWHGWLISPGADYTAAVDFCVDCIISCMWLGSAR